MATSILTTTELNFRSNATDTNAKITATASSVAFEGVAAAACAVTGVSTLNASSTITGGTITDGTLSSNAGTVTGGVAATFSGAVTGGSFTDSTLTISSGTISSGVAATFSGLVTGGSFTDGTLTISSGAISGLETTPSGDNYAASKAYVDSVAAGLNWKESCALTTQGGGNITLSGNQSIDGVLTVDGDRVLVSDQTTGSENGIYIADSGAWSRSADMPVGSDAAGDAVFIQKGTTCADCGFVCTNNTGSAVVGTDALSFTQFNGAANIVAGDGLTKAGNTLSVNVDDSSIEITADDLNVKALGITNAMLAGSIANAKLSNSTVGLIAGTSGTDVAVSGSPASLGGDLTINIPDAGAAARGVVTTGAQTFAGVKTFTSDAAFSAGLSVPDSQTIAVGTGDDLTIQHNGTNSLLTSAVGDLIIDNTLVTGSTIMQLGTDTTATDFQVQNNTGTAGLTVFGDLTAAFAGELSMGTNKITNVVDPTADQDAATKKYVDDNNATPGGSDTQLQFNNAGAFGGMSNITYDGTGGTAIRFADNAEIYWGTGGDLSVIHNATDSIIQSNTGDLIIDNTLVTGSTIMRLGTDSSATDFQVQGNSETALLTVQGDAQVTITGNLDANGGVDIPTDNTNLSIGAGLDFSILHNGTDTIMTSNTGDLVVDNTLVTGSTIMRLGTDTSAVDFQVQNNSAAAAFTVFGDSTAAFAGELTMGTNKITNVVDPTADQDAATKKYVDDTVAAAPGGADTQIQFNDGGTSFGGVSSWTTNGTTTFNGADNAVFNMGTGNDFSITHDATDTTITSTTGNLVVDNTNATGSTVMLLGATTTGVAFGVATSLVSTPIMQVLGDGQSAFSTRLSVGSSDYTAAAGTDRLAVPATIFTDSSTAGSGIATSWYTTHFEQSTLAATNSSVTTTDAATVYIEDAPAAGTNQTITNPHALLIASGITTLNDSTQSTTTTDGCLVLAGGMGCAKDVRIAGTAYALAHETTSDATLKTNILPLSDPLNKIKQIEGCSYNWKSNPDGKPTYGVLAQQLESIGLEHMVGQGEVHKTVNYTQLIPLLIESIKVMATRLDELEK